MERRHIVGFLLSSLLAVRGFRKRSLTLAGSGAAFVVGLVSFGASVRLGLTLITFYLTSTRLTRIGASRKRKLDATTGKHDSGHRSAVQVLANGGLGTCLAAWFAWHTRSVTSVEQPLDYSHDPLGSMLQVGYLCHYACVNADTWASELGVLSRSAPRLITTLQQVPPGTNGGVSVLGTTASALGGGLMGLTFWVLGAVLHQADTSAPPQWPLVPLGIAAGLGGSFIDSLLGATLQFSGFDEERRLAVSSPEGAAVRHTSGLNLLSNDLVNFCSSALTAAAGMVLCKELHLFG
jgi:uncharacterized protein (TIGR00297 family)